MHRGKVFGRTADTTGIAEFGELVTQIITQEPYASADRVFWIVDNGSSHRGQKAVDRLAKQSQRDDGAHPGSRDLAEPVRSTSPSCNGKCSRPTTSPISTPLPSDYPRSRTDTTRARPFRWKFTATDLTELLARLDNHKPMPEHDPAQPRAV